MKRATLLFVLMQLTVSWVLMSCSTMNGLHTRQSQKTRAEQAQAVMFIRK